jgi:hypothetical protein
MRWTRVSVAAGFCAAIACSGKSSHHSPRATPAGGAAGVAARAGVSGAGEDAGGAGAGGSGRGGTEAASAGASGAAAAAGVGGGSAGASGKGGNAAGSGAGGVPGGGTAGTLGEGGSSAEGGACGEEGCEPSCSEGWGRCQGDDVCRPLDSQEHCGACDHPACPADNAYPTCSAGTACLPPLCHPGFANCEGDDGCETAIAAQSTGCYASELETLLIDTEGSELNLAVGSDGATILAGSFGLDADFDPTSGSDMHAASGAENAFVTKIEADGSYAWTRSFGGTTSAFTSVAAEPDGSLVLSGRYEGSIDFDPGPGEVLRSTESFQGFVLKLDADGGLVWVRTFPRAGNSGYSIAHDVALASGAVYVTGWFNGLTDFDTETSGGERDVDPTPGQDKPFVARFTETGALDWVFSFPGPCTATGMALAAVADGVWLGGNFNGRCAFDAGDPLVPASLGYDAYLLKLSPSGIVLYAGTLSGEQSDDVRTAGALGASVYVAGSSSPKTDLDPGPELDERLVPTNGSFILKLGADGEYDWSQALGRFSGGSLPQLAVTPSGGVLVPAVGPFPLEGTNDPATGVVFMLNADRTPRFTHEFPGRSPIAIAVGAGRLAVGGHVDGGGIFVTRFDAASL